MPNDRFYSDTNLDVGSSIILEGQELLHLATVTRTKENDQVEIVNGKGVLAKATVISIDKRKATLNIDSIQTFSKPSFKIILAQAIPRINRLDFIVEKGTELGMSELLLFPGEKSEKKELTEQQKKRLNTISISAMKQCGRVYLPLIKFKPKLQKWESVAKNSYLGDLEDNAPLLKKVWETDPPSKECTFFIGPESGFTEKEVELLKKFGAKGVSIHQNVLRTDTAAITALALMHHLSHHHSTLSRR